MEKRDWYGGLLTPQIKIHRQYFREMVKLHGIHVLYRSPKPGKRYTTYAEIDSNYRPPILVGCLFDNHPTQQTLRKIGWVSEIQDGASLISVDYDLPDLQQGAIFIIPSGLDDGKAQVFRVSKITNDIIYPASITCEIVPEWEDTMNPDVIFDYSPSDNEFKTLDEVEVEPFASVYDIGYESIMVGDDE